MNFEYKLVHKKECCSGCSACMYVCKHGAITMQSDEKGFKYPIINTEKCVECNMCRKNCAFHNDIKNENQIILGIKHKKEAIRVKSASGGMFFGIASYVIANNGVVYGAYFDDDWEKVRHGRAERIEDVEKFMTSKYVQSDIGNVYEKVKVDLLLHRKVLFTGTPCQIAGVNSYISKQMKRIPDELITCDLICHGVPSPSVYKDYILYLKEKYSNSISEINFRDKCKGWSSARMKIVFKNKIYCERQNTDIYNILFFNHLSLRDSCFNCQFNSFERQGDFTIGDFWNGQNSYREFYDEKGVSLVFANTEKANKIFNVIKHEYSYFYTDREHCIQRPLVSQASKNNKMEMFWKDYNDKGFKYISAKYADNNLLGFLKRKLLYEILYKFNAFDLLLSLKNKAGK